MVFEESGVFAAIARQAFHKSDIDDSGRLSKDELHAAMMQLYFLINSKAGGRIVELPTRQQVDQVFMEFDTNMDGVLTDDEFIAFARMMFKKHAAAYLPRIMGGVALSLVILPAAAKLIKQRAKESDIPILRELPKAVIAPALGGLVKGITLVISLIRKSAS
eukprot:jgi/Chlat1/9065/Chrsp94S09270